MGPSRVGVGANTCMLRPGLVERASARSALHRGWDTPRVGRRRDIVEAAKLCKEVDRASYALLTDLKQPGRAEDTLVNFWLEFGRTRETRRATARAHGTRHHPGRVPVWLAGAAVNKGMTSDVRTIRLQRVEDPVTYTPPCHDPAPHRRDHTKLTYRFQGRASA